MAEYGIEDIVVHEDPMNMIRQRASWFAGEHPHGRRLAANLIRDIVFLNSLPVKLQKIDGWWVISSDKDWLDSDKAENALRPFFKIVKFPILGQLAIRTEVIVTALADAVVTATFDSMVWISGDQLRFLLPEQLNLICQNIEYGRVIAFLFVENDTLT